MITPTSASPLFHSPIIPFFFIRSYVSFPFFRMIHSFIGAGVYYTPRGNTTTTNNPPPEKRKVVGKTFRWGNIYLKSIMRGITVQIEKKEDPKKRKETKIMI